jgi:hypothetical protein
MTVAELQEELEKRKMWLDPKKERPRKDDYVVALEKDDAAGGNGVSLKGLSPPPKDTPKKKRGRSASRDSKKTKRARKDDSGDDQSGSDDEGKKGRKGKRVMSADQIKMKELREELNQLKLPELKDMLTKNDQKTSGKKSDLVERIADGKMYGALPRCPDCGGAVLKVKYARKYGHSGQGDFSCPGYFEDKTFVRCTHTSQNEKRPAWKD